MDIPRTLFDDLKQSIMASVEALTAGEEALRQQDMVRSNEQFTLARQHAETAQRTMRALEMREDEESSWNRLRGHDERQRADERQRTDPKVWEEP